MRKFQPPVLCFLLCLLALGMQPSFSQCDNGDFTRVKVEQIKTTTVSCPQNGAIIINGVSGGGGSYVYEIVDGPVIRGIQASNKFEALEPGRYKVRITGCNGTFYETSQVIVPNQYLEFATPTLRFLNKESFKCGITNAGKVEIAVPLFLPTNNWSDTLLYRSLRYQVSTNADAETGFENIPYRYFSYGVQSSRSDVSMVHAGLSDTVPQQLLFTRIDTITGLVAGNTYYIRVTDGCGTVKTKAISLPQTSSPQYQYSFAVKDPYLLSPAAMDVTTAKSGCVQWGELSISHNGRQLSAIPGSNGMYPVTVTVSRKDNGEILDTRMIQEGGLIKNTATGDFYNTTNNLLFDSLPRVPLQISITNLCGQSTVLETAVPANKQPLQFTASARCLAEGSAMYIKPQGSAPQVPLRLKLFGANGQLVQEKVSAVPYQYLFLTSQAENNKYIQEGTAMQVAEFGRYSLEIADDCGRKDTVELNYQPATIPDVPAISFKASKNECTGLYAAEAIYAADAGIHAVTLTQGPEGINYPVALTKSSFVNYSGQGTITYTPVKYFDQLKPGNYTATINYGCGQTATTSVKVNDGVPNAVSGKLNFTITADPCSPEGDKVKGEVTITSSDVNFVRNDKPCIRIKEAPLGFLNSISYVKKDAQLSLPFDLGEAGAPSAAENGIDTNNKDAYPLYSFIGINGGWFNYPAGTYTFELYAKCSGRILDTQTFEVKDGAYSYPTAGASAAYVCQDGVAKLVVTPAGGHPGFKYQIKLADIPGEEAYGSMQADSLFALPAHTKPGTVYSIKATDACNNSVVSKVTVTQLTDDFYISTSNDCPGAPARVFAGYVPGATYTWTKPDGTQIVTNNNELYLPMLQLADVGEYQLTINALGNCLSRQVKQMIGHHCTNLLPLQFEQFTITQAAAQLQWTVRDAFGVSQFVIERSADAEQWTAVGSVEARLTSDDTQQYGFKDPSLQSNSQPVWYYRIKAVNNEGTARYSPVRTAISSKGFTVIKMYPNPFRQVISIDFISETAGQAAVILHDVNGKEAARTNMPVAKGINSYQYKPKSSLEPGYYFVTLLQGNKRHTQKILKTQD